MAKSEVLPSFWSDSIASFSEMTKQSNERISIAFSEAAKNANRLQNEVIRFATDQFNRDSAALSRFALCKTPQEVLQVQSELFAELSAAYLEERQRVVSLLNEITHESFERFAAGAQRAAV